MTARLNIVVEGQTEEAFVNQVLAPSLGALGIAAVARCVETSRRRTTIYRGGLPRYDKLKGDLTRWMKQDRQPDAWFTTMIDLYGLDRLQDEFPGFPAGRLAASPYERIAVLEGAFAADISHPRFIPYLQLHEFEALILADPQKLDWEFIDRDGPIQRLVALVAGFDSPELIDDGIETSPCRRITREIPEYGARKASAGPLVTGKIGLPTLRQRCPHFAAWLDRLEALGSGLAP